MGALNFDRVEPEAIITDGKVQGIAARQKNRAGELIEDFMIAANEVMARTLQSAGVSAIRRVVKTPSAGLASSILPSAAVRLCRPRPDARALNVFLAKQKAADAVHYSDLSLSVIKLMGPGEYVLVRAGETGEGHFGLAVHDYTHSTAPNRRFADLVTQRLVKSALAGGQSPYSDAALNRDSRDM